MEAIKRNFGAAVIITFFAALLILIIAYGDMKG